MVARRIRPARCDLVALALLIAGLAHNVAFQWFDLELWGRVYKITGAALIAGLLVHFGWQYRRATVWAVVGLLLGYALMAIGCEVAYIVAPWPLDPGTPMCSHRLGLPLTLMGLGLACGIAGWIKGRADARRT